VREIVQSAPGLGIRWLTIYAFSTENWKRSTEEVLGLMSIFARYIEREADRLAAEGVRMRFIGDRSRLDPKLQRLMAGIEDRTAGLSLLNLTVAINYGGRNELVRAARTLAGKVAQGQISADSIQEETLESCLDTHDLPDPDLLARHFQQGVGEREGYYRVKPELRRHVTTEYVNLFQDSYPVPRELDAIFCRNVMIYFDVESRRLLVERLFEQLAPGGYLFVGHSESLLGLGHRFKAVWPSVYVRPS
jgi:hypothetical protein